MTPWEFANKKVGLQKWDSASELVRYTARLVLFRAVSHIHAGDDERLCQYGRRRGVGLSPSALLISPARMRLALRI